MNNLSDQDYLDDLPQVLLHHVNISSNRLLTKGESLEDNYHSNQESDAVNDGSSVRVTKSEIDDVGLDVDIPGLFKKEHFKFATQCPEISSQKGEKRCHAGNKVVRRAKEPPLNMAFPSKVLNYELKIIKQPEEQHRARYLTEGSRGTVKDKTGQGHPTVKLVGHDQPATLQVFVGSDSGKIKPHGFYQACKVSHKNSSSCTEREIYGTAVIEIPMEPNSDMTAVIDCVGILKLRNADVEQRIGLAKSKKKSTIARLVFRVNIPKSDSSYHTLQVSSTPILCTQPTGAPEISKKSLNQCTARGGEEMFIIGKNFTKGTTVYFEEVRDHRVVWSREADIDQDFFQSTHLVCTVPSYLNPNIKSLVEVQIVVNSSNRTSEPVPFTYLPSGQISENKSMRNSATAQNEANLLHTKPQTDMCHLKRCYALSDVSPEELRDVSFVLDNLEEKSCLSDPSISIESSVPASASPIIIMPGDMTAQQNAILDNINAGTMTSNFRDESVHLSLTVPMVGEDALKLDLSGEPRFKRIAHNVAPSDPGLQSFIDLVGENATRESLNELGEEKSFSMMWQQQDLSKQHVSLGARSISGESLGFAQDLHSFPSVQTTATNSSDALLLNFADSAKDSMEVGKRFLALSPIQNHGMMETFSDNMAFIHNLTQSDSGDRPSNNQIFLIGSKGPGMDQNPVLTEIGGSKYLKIAENMNFDEERSFGTEFLLSEKIADAGMCCNLQESLSELKNLTSKVGMSALLSQDEKPMGSFVDQDIVSQIIDVDDKFIYPPSISDAPQMISAAEPSLFENNPMGSFAALSSSYEMVSDLRSFDRPPPFGEDLRSEARQSSERMSGISFDDKTLLSIGLMDPPKNSVGTLSRDFTMMETHSDSQNLLMNRSMDPIGESLCLPRPGSEISPGYQSSPESQQVFSEKGLDQSMAIRYQPGIRRTCIIAGSTDKPKAADQSELFYLLAEDMPGSILAPLAQQNQISPLPNLTVEEVSQVLNMSGSQPTSLT